MRLRVLVRRIGSACGVCAVALVAAAAPAGAQSAPAMTIPPTPQPYGTNDVGGFYSIIPPGEGTNTTAADTAAFELNGSRPAVDDNQRAMYTNLLYATPGLKASDVLNYFHDATFGVKASDIASSESPRADVTIVRDRGFGIPHVYGSTRDGTMFGAGYVGAEDRLFFMDVLRHAGSATLSTLAGGSSVGMDESVWASAPYTDADYQRMFDQLASEFGAEGVQIQADVRAYVAGVNAYVNAIKLDPTLMPVEYPALGHPLGPDPWKVTDVIKVGTLIGSLLGNGGGGELGHARLLELAQNRFGAAAGARVTASLNSANDPEAPLSISGGSFPYDLEPPVAATGSVALPDRGTLRFSAIAANQSGSAKAPGAATPVSAPSAAAARPAARAPFGLAGSFQDANVASAGARGLFRMPTSDSNALLVSARKSVSGHPLLVAGSQAAYFAPEIYMEEDLHGPGIDARGAAVTGANLYVVIGHGRDYAWSATSASQDIIDTFAVDLCNQDGSPATVDSNSYLYHGQCFSMETLSKPIAWSPNLADSTPTGSETLVAQRTKYGIVYARGMVGGAPVAFTHLRTTYLHEFDVAPGFYEFDNPDVIHNVSDYFNAAYKIGYTFNWLYADSRDIGMFTSGAEPLRAPDTNGTLPIRARAAFEWQNFNPDINSADYVPADQHPQVVNQDIIESWNTKQAHDFASSEPRTPVWRGQLLEDRLRTAIAAKGKLALTDVIDAMEGAATADLRGDKTLPWLLKVIGTPSDPVLADAVAKLRAWQAAGAPRRDSSRSGHYDYADAVRIFDAWQHPLQKAIFEPVMGKALYDYFAGSFLAGEDTPNSFGTQLHSHLGSSWEQGAFMFEQKDLRTVLADAASRPAAKGKRKRRARHVSHRKRPAVVRARVAAVTGAAAVRRGSTKSKRGHHKRVSHKRHRKVAAAPTGVQGRYAVDFCGGGDLARCRDELIASLREALAIPASTLYADPTVNAAACGFMDQQQCYDSIRFRPIGLIGEPLIPWQNRPTQQQAVEVMGQR